MKLLFKRSDLAIEYFISDDDEATLSFLIPGVNEKLIQKFRRKDKNQAKISATIGKFLLEKKTKKLRITNKVDIYLFGSQVLQAYLPLPKGPSNQSFTLVKNDLHDRFGPTFDKDYYYVTHFSKSGQGNSLAISEIVKKNYIDEITSIVKGAELEVGFLAPGNMSLRAASRYKNGIAKGVEVYVKESFSSISLIYGGQPLSYSYIPYGYTQLVDATQNQEAMAALNREIVSMVGETYFGLDRKVYPTIVFFGHDNKVAEAYGANNILDVVIQFGGHNPAYQTAKSIHLKQNPTHYGLGLYLGNISLTK